MEYTWKDLEDDVYQLLKFDKPRKPAGSGSAKNEEDVISESFIAQCKHTNSNSISIKKSDIERLINASYIKTPLFVIGVDKLQMLGFINDKEITPLLIKFVALLSRLRLLDSCAASSAINISTMRKEVAKVEQIYTELANEIGNRISNLNNTIDAREEDLLTINMFE